jgi:hypothetical protein
MQILSGIHQVDGVSSNVFLLVEDAGLTAIDSGGPGSGPKISPRLAGGPRICAASC